MTTENHSTDKTPPTERVYEVMDDTELSFVEKQRRVLTIAREYLGVTNGHIQRHPSDQTTDEILVSVGEDSELLPEGTTLDRSKTYCRQTVKEPSPLAISNASKQRWQDDPAYKEHDIDCYLGTTLFVRGEVYGTVCFMQRTSREDGFTTEEKMFIELVARLLGREIEATILQQQTDEKEALQAELEKTTRGTLQLASELEERYQRLFENAIEGIYTTTDTLEEYEMANPAFADLLGYESGEELCTAVDSIEDDVFVDSNAYATYSETLTSVGELDQFEYRVRTANGEIRWVSDSVTALTDDEEGIEGYRGGIIDITDQKKREKNIVRQQQLNTVLLRVFRHNIRNEFTVIRGHTEMMADQFDDESNDVNAVISAIDRILSLAEKSTKLDAFLMEEIERKSFNMMTMIQQVSTDIDAEYPEASIEVTGPDELPISGYPNLKDAISELIENACKHAGDTPTVTVSAEVNHGTIELEISDDGPGLPKQEYRVLEMGTEEPLVHGQGLGLWMVYWVVTGHDGYIETSASDEGTTITITLPQSTVGPEIQDTSEMVRNRHQSGNIFQQIFEETSDALVIVDDSGQTLRANESGTNLIGLPKKKILGRSFDEFFTDDFDVFEMSRSNQASGLQRETTTLVRPDGSERIVECSVTNDIIPGLHLIVCRDITKRKEHERRYNVIFNHTYQFTGLLEPDGTVIEANESALEFGNLDRENVVGKPFWEVCWWQHNDATQQEVREAIDRAAASEFVRYETEVQGAEENAVIDFSIRPITDEQDTVILLVPEGRDITELKERERELRLFRKAVEASGHSIIFTDVDGTIEYVNPAFEEISGYTAEEAIGCNPRILKSGDHDQEFYQELWDVILGGNVWRNEIINVTKSGDRYVIDQTIAPVDGESGEIEHFVAVNGDITERKERERELSTVKERYETLLRAAPDPVFVADGETGEIIEVNDAAETLLRMSSDDIVGSHQSELHPSEQADLYEQLFEEHVQTGGTKRRLPDGSRIHVVTNNGDHVPVEINVETVSLPDGPVTYGIFRDISERVEREEELAEKTRLLEAIVQNTSEAIYIKDTEGYYQFINESGAELFGQTSEEIIGKHDNDLFDPESAAKIRATDKQVIESGEVLSEETVRFIDGEKHVFLDTKYPYRDGDGEIIGLIGISPGISEH